MSRVLARRAALLGTIVPPTPNFQLKGDGTLWQNSARSTPATTDGDPIGAWDDSVGSSHWLQATSGSRPTLRTNAAGHGLNGKNVVRVDGSATWIGGATPAQANQTWAIVAKKNSALAAAVKTLWQFDTASTREASVFTSTGGDPTGYSYQLRQAGGTENLGGSPTAWHIFMIRYSGTSAAKTWVGGGAGVSFDPNDSYASATASRVGAGLLGGGPTEWGDFDIAEIRRWNTDLTLTQVNAVGIDLAAAWAQSWSNAT